MQMTTKNKLFSQMTRNFRQSVLIPLEMDYLKAQSAKMMFFLISQRNRVLNLQQETLAWSFKQLINYMIGEAQLWKMVMAARS